MQTRIATPDDAAAIAEIYNQGIEDGNATFEIRLRTVDDVKIWFDGFHPIVVVEASESLGAQIVAFASTSYYRQSRECYNGIAEFSVYVRRERRGEGAGRLALQALFREVEQAGIWKLVSRVFTENRASLALLKAAGFREVGIYEKHAKLRDAWKDVVIVEKLFPSNLK